MITILEGGDGTGKTTLAIALGKRMCVPVLHYGPPGMNPVLEYTERPAEAIGQEGGAVLDRSFIGGRVWSQLGFHAPVLDHIQWRMVCQWYADLGGRTFVILKDPAAITEEINERGEPWENAQQAIMGQTMFLRMLARHEILYMPVTALSTGASYAMMEGE